MPDSLTNELVVYLLTPQPNALPEPRTSVHLSYVYPLTIVVIIACVFSIERAHSEGHFPRDLFSRDLLAPELEPSRENILARALAILINRLCGVELQAAHALAASQEGKALHRHCFELDTKTKHTLYQRVFYPGENNLAPALEVISAGRASFSVKHSRDWVSSRSDPFRQFRFALPLSRLQQLPRGEHFSNILTRWYRLMYY